MYPEEIMDHYKNPRNQGNIQYPDYEGEHGNPVCGDLIKMSVKTRNGVIEEIKFDGEGCAISMASASILTEMVKGKTTRQVLEMDEKEFIDKIGNIQTRTQCVLVSLNALKKALGDDINC